MAYIPPAGKAAKGEGAEDLPRIRVVYVERGFDCVSLVGPGQNLLSAVELAMDHGLTEASKQLGLSRSNLSACVSAPLHKEDGSLLPAEGWASRNCIYIRVDPGKEQEGLLGKFRKQHDYMEKLVKQNVVLRDVTASSGDCKHSASTTQVEALTSEISDLKRRNSDLEAEVADLKRRNSDLERRNSDLERRNSDLEAEVQTLKDKISSLNEDISSLKTMISDHQKQLSQLSGMERIMMRKMLDQCRQKSIQILRAHIVPLLDESWRFPEDWPKVLNDGGCTQLLRNAGLDKGLLATRFGKRSLQSQGSSAAHLITESPEVYATIVCKMTGDARDQMQNVFSFVFGCSAEELAFGDDEFPFK